MSISQQSHMAGVSPMDKYYWINRQILLPLSNQATEIRPFEVEMFVIRIQHDFTKKVILPPLNVWKRVVDRCSFRFASLDVKIKRRVFFQFERYVSHDLYTCVMSRQGHLVIYTDNWKHEGFAVNLNKATRVVFKCKQQKKKLSKTMERICNVHVEWQFGSVKIRLPESLVLDWGSAILKAVSGKAEVTNGLCHWRDKSATCYENSTHDNSTQTMFAEHSQISTCVEKAFDIGSVGTSGFAPTTDTETHQTAEEGSFTGEYSMVEAELLDLIHRDQSFNSDNGQEEQTQSTVNEEHAYQKDLEEIPYPLEKALMLNFPPENEQQQQENEYPEDLFSNASSLRRRVTFSDLNTIFEAPESGTALEEGEYSNNELTQEDSVPKLGCQKDNEGIDLRRKEHIVQSALDQMRIVGQHGVKETTTCEELNKKENEDSNDDNEDKQHKNATTPQPCEQMTTTTDGDNNFVSTQQLALKMQFPSQSERFDRTRELFEHGTGGIINNNNNEEEEDKSK